MERAPDLWTCNQGADLDLHKVAASQLAVDGKVEQCSIPRTTLTIQKEADRPNLPNL
jgi:hypothetical protein